MAKRRPPRAVEWLLREGGDEQAVPASSRMSFEDEHWSASIERLDIGEGLRVFLTKAEIRRGLSLEPLQSVPGVWLSSKIAVRGRVAVSFSDGAHIELTPDRSMLCRPNDGKARFTPKPRQSLHLAGYMLRADRIVSLCDGDVPAAIRPLIAPEVDRDLLLKIATTTLLRRTAVKMFSDQFAGSLREVYLEGIALQLFAIQSAAAAGGARARASRTFSASERATIHEARERLLADMANPPSAAAIAAAAEMSERRLNAGFRALFGTTIFETLRNERLEHARTVLETEALPMKLVAERVGYRHVTKTSSTPSRPGTGRRPGSSPAAATTPPVELRGFRVANDGRGRPVTNAQPYSKGRQQKPTLPIIDLLGTGKSRRLFRFTGAGSVPIITVFPAKAIAGWVGWLCYAI